MTRSEFALWNYRYDRGTTEPAAVSRNGRTVVDVLVITEYERLKAVDAA